MSFKTILHALTFASLLATLLTGCSSSSSKHQSVTVFKTRIIDSGLKHFEIRRGRAQPSELGQRNQRNRDQPSNRPARNPKKTYERNLKKLRKHAEETIEVNQFCTTGFWVIEYDTDTRGAFLRGECNETATEADRKSFPDTITYW